VRELVAGKRRWSSPPDRMDAMKGFKGWQERGYLPHRDEPGLIQFITFQLKDAFPAALKSEWAALLAIEEDREQRKQLENYLDRGKGECLLGRADLAAIVEGALRFHHGTLYELRAWVVMANHAHVLLKVADKSWSAVVADWKEYTAREANKVLGRRGQFWAKDSWDTYMRDSDHELRARNYIENNPVKARLVRDPKDWPWSSARFRDKMGKLHL
jgi:REP element-mobilizing transposase RayT